MKCLVIQTSPERISAEPVTNEDGSAHVYATISEARAELKANGYSYNRANDRYYIKGTEYRAYIVREDSEEYAEIIAEQAHEDAARSLIQTVSGNKIYRSTDPVTGWNVFTVAGRDFWELAEARYFAQCNPAEAIADHAATSQTTTKEQGAQEMKTAEDLIKAYAEAIEEPTPAYMAKSARLVFLAHEEGGKKPAPMHYDTVDRMQRVVAAHESDPDALRELFDSLQAGAVYGHQVNNVPCPFFWENVGIHDGYIKWNHYGASAEAVSMNDLAFIVFTIFRTTPREFMSKYERR